MRATIGSDNFNKNFLISLWGHVILVTFALVGGDVLAKYFGSSDVEIVRSAIRVDVVGMPKFTVQELKELEKIAAELPKEPEAVKAGNAPAKPETADVIKKDDLVIQEVDKKKKKSSFLSVLNEYSTKKVSGKEQKKGKKEGASDKNLEALVLEGNRLSQGTALTGDYADGPGSEFAGYVQTLPGVIRPQWKLPQYLMDKNLRCRIRIFLSSTGKLLKLEVVESSGEPEFDGRAENALRTTEFPKPSDEVAKRLTRSGIILGFPL